MHFVVGFDHWLFFLINGHGVKGLDRVFADITSLGGFTIAFVAFAFLAGVERERFRRHLVVMLLGMAVSAGVAQLVKRTVNRDRPLRAFSEQIASGSVKVRVIGKPLKKRSFPSGHTMTAFYFMVYVVLARRASAFWALLLAGLVGLSRVYVGAHFPLDCLAGALHGALFAWLSWKAFMAWDGKKT